MITGAITIGILDWVLEHYWYTHGQPTHFPYKDTPIAPYDDIISCGIVPGAITAIGLAMKQDAVRDFGIGGLIYGGVTLLHHALLRNITKP